MVGPLAYRKFASSVSPAKWGFSWWLALPRLSPQVGCSAKMPVIILRWGLLPPKPRVLVPCPEAAWAAEGACLLFLGRQDSSRCGPEDAKCISASSAILTTVLCVESQMGTTHVAYVTQPQVGRTGLEPSCAMFVSPQSSRFLAGCTCMCLGIRAVCDWKWRGRLCMDQAHPVPAWASEQAAFCVEVTLMVVVDLAAPVLAPPSLLHGLHK